jgi:hypothetical protein
VPSSEFVRTRSAPRHGRNRTQGSDAPPFELPRVRIRRPPRDRQRCRQVCSKRRSTDARLPHLAGTRARLLLNPEVTGTQDGASAGRVPTLEPRTTASTLGRGGLPIGVFGETSFALRARILLREIARAFGALALAGPPHADLRGGLTHAPVVQGAVIGSGGSDRSATGANSTLCTSRIAWIRS